MPIRRTVRRHALLLGALLLAAACHPAAAPSSNGAPPMVHRDAGRQIVRGGSRAELAEFSLEVPLTTDSGVCVRRPVPMGVGEMVSLYYPDVQNAVAVATVNVDPSGRMVRFSDRRGRVKVSGLKGVTGRQLDSAFAAARRETRSSTVYLDYVLGQAMLSNDGGGREDESIMVPLTAVANEARFGAPDSRARALLARCGATPSSGRSAPASAPPHAPDPAGRCGGSYFEFQVEKPAFYLRDPSLSPHPVDSASTLVQFVVDTTGRVEIPTFRVLRTPEMALIDEVKQVLARWKYLPAEINGCKVKQLVQTGVGR